MSEIRNHSDALDRAGAAARTQAQLKSELLTLAPILRAQREALGRASRAVLETERAQAFAARAYHDTLAAVNVIRAELGEAPIDEVNGLELRLEARLSLDEDEHATSPGCA